MTSRRSDITCKACGTMRHPLMGREDPGCPVCAGRPPGAVGLLHRLDEEATAGPWRHGRSAMRRSPLVLANGSVGETHQHADARLVATMRTLLPELIELARAARIEVRCNSGCAKSCRSGRHHPGCPMNDCCETADALAALDAKAATMETEA